MPWYRQQKRWVKIGLVCIFPLLALLTYVFVGAAAGQDGGKQDNPVSSPTTVSMTQQGETRVQQNTARATAVNIPSLRALTPSPQPRQTAPTQAPTPTSLPTQKLFVKFVAIYSVDYASAKARIHTIPGATLAIDVVYCSGESHDQSDSLEGTVNADSKGFYTWHWVPQTPCKGQARAYVTVNYGNQTLTIPHDFMVQ